jgi:hypothetical protein
MFKVVRQQKIEEREAKGQMRPGLEKWFEEETAELHDKSIPYAVRLLKWRRLVQAQEGVVRIHKDGSIASPIDPEDTKDANEYLEQLRRIRIAL